MLTDVENGLKMEKVATVDVFFLHLCSAQQLVRKRRECESDTSVLKPSILFEEVGFNLASYVSRPPQI